MHLSKGQLAKLAYYQRKKSEQSETKKTEWHELQKGRANERRFGHVVRKNLVRMPWLARIDSTGGSRLDIMGIDYLATVYLETGRTYSVRIQVKSSIKSALAFRQKTYILKSTGRTTQSISVIVIHDGKSDEDILQDFEFIVRRAIGARKLAE